VVVVKAQMCEDTLRFVKILYTTLLFLLLLTDCILNFAAVIAAMVSSMASLSVGSDGSALGTCYHCLF
jgi:hypothetical protein